MKLTIELDREADGRWIAEVPQLNVILYGDSRQDAIQKAQVAAREIILDRIAHPQLPPDSAYATFDIAASVPGPRQRRGVCSLLVSGSAGDMTAPQVPTKS